MELLGNLSNKELEISAKHLITLLEGHLTAISRVCFSNLGDRLITGSHKDGDIRIWSFNKNYSKNVCFSINLSDDANFGKSPKKGCRGRQRKVVKQARTTLHNACWTCDDKHVVTMQSVPIPQENKPIDPDVVALKVRATRMKVWSSVTGDLLQIINVSKTDAHCLVPHPFDPSIIVTSGVDGVITMWDIELKETYCQFAIVAPEGLGEQLPKGTPIRICDVNFSPDGTRLSASDNIGRIFLYGIDSPERFKSVQPEQYFETDFNEFVVDAEGWALDVNTQLPVHLAPRGLIVMSNGHAFADQATGFSMPVPFTRSQLERELSKLEEEKVYLYEKVMNQTFKTQESYKLKNRGTDSARARVDAVGFNNGKIHTIWDRPNHATRAISSSDTPFRSSFSLSSPAVGNDYDGYGLPPDNDLSFSDGGGSNYSGDKWSDSDSDISDRQSRNPFTGMSSRDGFSGPARQRTAMFQPRRTRNSMSTAHSLGMLRTV